MLGSLEEGKRDDQSSMAVGEEVISSEELELGSLFEG
jgi:hypothetical protein